MLCKTRWGDEEDEYGTYIFFLTLWEWIECTGDCGIDSRGEPVSEIWEKLGLMEMRDKICGAAANYCKVQAANAFRWYKNIVILVTLYNKAPTFNDISCSALTNNEQYIS